MTFVHKSDIVNLSNSEEREKFIDESSELLRDAVIIKKKWLFGKVEFKLIRKEKDKWYDCHLTIDELVDFYFRRFETGLIRSGLRNLRRLNLIDGKVEHISAVSYFKHKQTGKDGIQILLYSGKMLRFLGDRLVFDLEDGDEVSNTYLAPKKVETPLTKLLYFPHRIARKSRKIVDKIHETATKVAIQRDENYNNKTQPELRKKNIISPEFEEFTKLEEEVELDEEQKKLVENILIRMREVNKDLSVREPQNYYEIFDFEDANSYIRGVDEGEEISK